jgi:hypothetical protein
VDASVAGFLALLQGATTAKNGTDKLTSANGKRIEAKDVVLRWVKTLNPAWVTHTLSSELHGYLLVADAKRANVALAFTDPRKALGS